MLFRSLPLRQGREPSGQALVAHLGMSGQLLVVRPESAPERHLRAAQLLSPGVSGSDASALPGVIASLMRDIGIPNGLAEVGYGAGDVDALVEGALQQQRLLATAPKEVSGEDLATIMTASLEHW